jgi:hypothetical protein
VKHQIKDNAKDQSNEEELESTINQYGIGLDKEAIQAIKADGENKLWKRYVRDKIIPKPYHTEDCWDRPLAKAPGRKSFEKDANKFLRLITKDP